MNAEARNLYDKCVSLMYHHVYLTMNDGNSYDGIIEAVDRDHMTVLIGEDVSETDSAIEQRQYAYDGYGRPRRRFRRFRRRRLPLTYVTAIALLPYYLPLPVSYYPYY